MLVVFAMEKVFQKEIVIVKDIKTIVKVYVAENINMMFVDNVMDQELLLLTAIVPNM